MGGPSSLRSSKRNRKVSDRMGVVDDAERQVVAKARLDALEDGGGDDPMAGDDNDDEFDMDDELDVEVTARGKAKKRGKGVKKKVRRFEAPGVARSFAILLEESGLLEKRGDPNEGANYFTVSARQPASSAPRKFCSVCGAISKYTCVRCGSRFCCKRCNTTHVETRCLKFAL